MGGSGADERAFDILRQMRADNEGLTLEAFKQTVREQYFSLVLDPDGALAAIPSMLPTDANKRTRILAAIHRTAEAAGAATGERAARLAKLEELFQPDVPAVTAKEDSAQSRSTAKS
jgi:hypothetical protein